MTNFLTLQQIPHDREARLFTIEGLYAPYVTAVVAVDSIESVALAPRLALTRLVNCTIINRNVFGTPRERREKERRTFHSAYVEQFTVTLKSGDEFQTTTDLRGVLAAMTGVLTI